MIVLIRPQEANIDGIDSRLADPDFFFPGLICYYRKSNYLE